MWQQLLTSFVAGVSVGPSCLLHCGVFHGAFLTRYAQTERRRQVSLGAALLGGRLAAYLLFGVLLGLIAATGILLPQRWLLTTILGVLMLMYALLPRRPSAGCACGNGKHGVLGGALVLGFVTGLSPCPPFLASGVIALHCGGVGAAVLTLLAFFLGSSVYLLPLWFGLAAAPERLRRRLGICSRILAGAVALYAFWAIPGLYAGASTTAGSGNSAPPSGNGPEHGGPPAIAAAGDTEEAAGPSDADRAREGSLDLGNVPPPASDDLEPLFEKEAPTRRFTAKLLQRLQLSLKEARHYVKLEDGGVECQLCPRRCLLDEGEQGMCRARVNIEGKLRSIVYARPVSLHVDPVEKKPLYHVLPGSKAFSMATVGCNLGCVFCQNFEISQAAPEELRHHNVPPEQLAQLSLKHQSAGIAYTYTEPTVFFEYMMDTATRAHKRGLKNYWVTCGQIEEAPLLELCDVLDAANVDLKGFSDEFYVKYCNAHLYPVLRTLKILRREKVHFEITNLLIPDANDDPAMIRDMCKWIVKELGKDTPIHFSRFHPAYKLTRRPATPVATLTMARDIARSEGLQYIYVGNIRGPGFSDTVCPICGKELIQRLGYHVIANDVKDGRCKFCGAPVAGVWE